MNFKEKLIQDLTKDEGLRLKPYRCTSNKLTIGYGRNIQDNGISESEASYMLSNDIQSCIAELDKRLYYFSDLPETVKSVLVNMCFNLGITRLMKFSKTLMYIEHRDYKAASIEMMDSKWAEQVGIRAVRLSRELYES